MHGSSRIAYWILCPLACYLLVEGIFSALVITGFVAGPPPFYVFEDTGKTVHFDPVLGFRYTEIPSRSARISYGTLEFVAQFHGNNLGFRDPDDMFPSRSEEAWRIAVLGDSFTVAEHLDLNWPARVEHLSANHEMALDLLNLSVSGGGLANWWSIVTRLLEPQRFDLDGLIFAVFEGDHPGDLHRTFSVADHRGFTQHMFGRTPEWDPTTWPTTLEAALPLMQPLRGYIVPPDTFGEALAGNWSPDPPPPLRPYAAALLADLGRQLMRALRSPPHTATPPLAPFSPGQRDLMVQLRAYAERHSLPILVVAIPSREDLLEGRPSPADIRDFADLLGATFIDGSEAFAGLDRTAIRTHWLPYDGHWAAAGSDRFADFILPRIYAWLASSATARSSP